MKQNTIITLFITTVLFTSCAGVKLQDYPMEPCVKLPGDKTVSVMNDKCGLCHKGDFATKELICGRKAAIIDAVSAKRMPKFKNLSENELKTILKWEQ